MLNSVVPQGRVTRRSTLLHNSSCVNNFSPITTRRSVAPADAAVGISNRKVTATPKTPLVLSQEPKTPTVTRSKEATPRTKYVDPVMARIQRDLNSPSANARVRANKALKDPDFRTHNYGQFDVPHEMQDLITEEERKQIKPKTNEEIFAKVIIYVEVRTGDDNRSAGIKNHLLRNGITVNEKLYKDTTHVIFKDGLLSTYKNAKKLGIPVTTILWADACLSQRRLVDPEKFKISNLDRYERPELYKRIRRQKSIQPEISKVVNPHFFSTMNKSITLENTRKNLNNDMEVESVEHHDSAHGMELTLQNENSSFHSPEVMEIEMAVDGQDKETRKTRRFTTFTPQPMEQTGIALELRRTIFASQKSKESDEVSTPEGNGFSANSCNTIAFNSSNRLSKFSRRSVFDISMNIFELNCKALSQKNELENEDQPLSAKKKVQQTATEKACDSSNQKQAEKPNVIRKRKLFNNDSFEEVGDCKDKENLNKSVGMPLKKVKTVIPSFNTPQLGQKTKPKIDRRRTLAYFKTGKPKEVAVKPKTPAKPQAAPQKYVVCTNMSSNDKKIISAAVEKLGGKVETEVTSKTTHIVSPTEERTMNILRGVIRACVIVNVSWIHESLAKDKWLETSTYQLEISDSNKVYERSVLGTKNYKNLSFANRGSFYLNKETIDNANKVNYLTEVIELCSGAITENKTEARYIVSDQSLLSKNHNQVHVNSMYIFDSAMKGTLLEVTRSYIPKPAKA